MICDRCGAEMAAEDAVQQGSQHVCEDCAMDMLSPAKACDPWAVKMAKGSVTTAADAASSLVGAPKAVYELVRNEGRVPRERLPKLLGLSPAEVDRACSTLRHMELLRGDRRADGGADMVLFDTPQGGG